MANAWARDRASFFYLGFGFYALAAVFFGFSTTYFAPMSKGSFAAPPIVHLHGALCLSWVVLVIAQSALVRNSQTRLHRQIGKIESRLHLAS